MGIVTFSELAQRQLDDYDRREPGTVFADADFRLTEAEAFRLQIAVAALRQARGEVVAGYKIGCVSEVVRRQLGLSHAVFGHVFAGELHRSGCTLDPSRYAGLAIEGEFAVRIACDIPGVEWLERNLAQAISWVFPVIELHNYVLRSSGLRAQELIANNGIHAGVVLPERESDNYREWVSVGINGDVRGTAASAAHSGLLNLVARLSEFGITLKAGQIA